MSAAQTIITAEQSLWVSKMAGAGPGDNLVGADPAAWKPADAAILNSNPNAKTQ